MQKPRITDEHPWIRYAITAAAGLAIVVVGCLIKGVFKEMDAALRVRYLSDAFLTAGVMLAGFGLLSFLKKEGAFDGLFFSFHTAFAAFGRRNSEKAENKGKTYYDYKQKVKAKRKTAWHMVIVGGGYLIVAIALTIVHTAAF